MFSRWWLVSCMLGMGAGVELGWCAPAGRWHELNSPTTNVLRAVAGGGEGWVAAGNQSTLVRSEDGYRWRVINHNLDQSSDFLAVTYGLGIFVAGGTRNVFRCISRDGTNWTVQATGGDNQRITGLTFSDRDQRFVAVGIDGSTGVIMSSTNGVDWTSHPIPSTQPLHAVAYTAFNFSRPLFVAAGDGGTILTSSNGVNWSLRASGVNLPLRAAGGTGQRYAVASENVVLVSSDAVSWPVGAPPSFAVRALAYGRYGLAGVGNHQSLGRAHITQDPQSWPGSADELPNVLNGVGSDFWTYVTVGDNGLIATTADSYLSVTNRWTKPSSGDWEELFWSLGERPAYWNGLVAINNPGWKAVAINPSTVSGYPSTLKLNALTVSAPVDSQNLLMLNYAGLNTPLEVYGRLWITTNGALLSQASAMSVGSLEVNTRATFSEFSRSEFTNVFVSGAGGAELAFSNGLFSVKNWLVVGEFAQDMVGAVGPGVFTQTAGTNGPNILLVRDGGVYNMRGGELDVGEQPWGGLSVFGFDSPARLNISGGRVQAGASSIGSWGSRASPPAMVISLAGGSFRTDQLDIQEGVFDQTGGFSQAATVELSSISAQYRLQNGSLVTGGIGIGVGAFNQSAGAHTNTTNITIYGFDIQNPSRYSLSGGVFGSPLVSLQRGQFLHTGTASARIGRLEVQQGGSYTLLENAGLTSSNVLIGHVELRNGTFNQSGGVHTVEGALTISGGGLYHLQGGTLMPRAILLTDGGHLQLRVGTLRNNQRITFVNGLLSPRGVWELGELAVAQSGSLRFESNQVGSVRFADSRAVTWGSYPSLEIWNWTGNTNGGTTHHVYVGTSNFALTPEQIASIRFVDPTGWPRGVYSGRILFNGELVPVSSAVLQYARSGNKLVLRWPQGYQLFTSTNVAGPYQHLPAASPYTNFFTEPKRFFFIAPQP